MPPSTPCSWTTRAPSWKGAHPTDAPARRAAMTVLQPELVARLAVSFPDAVAWRNLADGDGLTLAGWHTCSNRLAHGLQGLGVGRGDRVGLVMDNGRPLQWLVSYLGIHKARAVAVPLLARLR